MVLNPKPADYQPAPLIERTHVRLDHRQISAVVSAVSLAWVIVVSISFISRQACSGWRSRALLIKGTGIWGINIPVGWGFAIINFVWWIGIGHAGTLISAILLLLKQGWPRHRSTGSLKA
jgi:hypothetical protein